jgi:hypothetical protein
MFKYGERVPINILTERGIIPIEKTRAGDYVYEYNTGKRLEVKNIIDLDIDDIYEITFSDHRKSYSYFDDFVYLGNYTTTLKKFVRNISYVKDFGYENIRYGNIIQFPIEYEKSKIKSPLTPDPYIAGVLLIYGNYNSKHINIPNNLNIPGFLFFKYNLEYGSVFEENNMTFIKNKDASEKNITWEEFFPSYKFYAKSHDNNDPIIPDEYMFGSINDREQFIRGIFDIGSYLNTYKDFVGISHSEETMLKEVQKVLWSLGILSTISYNPNYETGNRVYHLKIEGQYENYPGLFYDINKIEKSIENRFKYREDFKMNLKDIKWRCMGYITNIVLEKPNMYYITENFLPKISL